MDMRPYMVHDAVYEEIESTDEDTMTDVFKAPVNIKVYKYGKTMLVRNGSDHTVADAKTYLTLYPVKIKSKLNGQVIRAINTFEDGWKPGKQQVLYRVYTWDA